MPPDNTSVEDELRAMREVIANLEAEVTMLKRKVGTQRDFVVAQYNILAGYLGDNRQPWFLYGVDLSEERRKEIFTKFYQKDEHGDVMNRGWPKFVNGILSEDEIARVEEVNDNFFSWERRKKKLLETITNLDADLLSLVECDNYDDYFRPELEKLGYGAIYKKRPRPGSNDGCAIFYHRSTFELETSSAVEFKDCFIDARTGIFSKDRVALFALLRHASGRRLIFISTHLARNPEDPTKTKCRAKQVGQLLYRLAAFATEHHAMNVPVILAGDMNATNLKQIEDIARVVFRLSSTPTHPFVFRASSPGSKPTSVTSVRKMRIDHLCLQLDRLEVLDSFEMEELSQDNPIPNERHPSDHLPLVFRVGFKTHEKTVKTYARAWLFVIFADRIGHLVQPELVLGPSDLRIAFEFFDFRNDGVCCPADFASGLRELKMSDKLPDLLQTLETYLGRSVAEEPFLQDEFVSIYINCLLKMKQDFLQDLTAAYSFFDSDKSGFLDFDELYQSFASTCPFELSVEAFKEVYDKLDANHDGVVTIDEFFEFLVKSVFSNDKTLALAIP